MGNCLQVCKAFLPHRRNGTNNYQGEKGMTPSELYDKINDILPNAIFDEDSSGEVIIATGFKYDENSNLVKVG
jgi:hypothetical protein